MRYGSVWPRPPSVVIRPQTTPRIHGWPRPVRLPSSDSASAKPMLMPAPTEAASPTRKASQGLRVAKAAAKQRRERGDRAIHQAGQAGLDDLQDEKAAAGFVLVWPDIGTATGLALSSSAVSAWQRSSSARSPSSWRMPASVVLLRGRLVEAARLHLHRAGLVAHGFEAAAAGSSQTGLRFDEALHVLPANQRDVFAEALPVKFDQAVAVAGLFARACLRRSAAERESPARKPSAKSP